MERFNGSAKEARKQMETVGKDCFRNLIFKRINENSRAGFKCLVHTYGTNNDEECIDDKIVRSIVEELCSLGYKVEDIKDSDTNEKLGLIKIEW